MLDLCGIVLRFRRQANLVRLEPIEDVTLRDGIDAEIADVFNSRPLLYIHVQDPAFRRRLTLESDVLEIICVPERVKVALDGALIENISRPGEYVRPNGFRRDAAIAVDFDSGDHVRLLLPNQACLKNAQRG